MRSLHAGKFYRQQFSRLSAEYSGFTVFLIDDEGNVFYSTEWVHYDRNRLERFLPRLMVGDEIDGRYSSNYENFDADNLEFMEGLVRAVETGRVLVSYKTRFILKNQFQDVRESHDVEELENLRAENVPFGLMKKLNRATRVSIVENFTNRQWCDVVITNDSGLNIVTSAMNANRKREFLEDLEFRRNQYRDGIISPKDILKNIKEIKTHVESLGNIQEDFD